MKWRLVEKKGIEYSIRGVAQLIGKFPQIKYTIAGEGTLKDNLQKLILELNAQNNIYLVGSKTQDEIVTLLNETQILLACSVTAANGDQEGIPVILMEALACGIPVLSTNHSGIAEIIHDNISGFLVAERNVDAITQKLEYMILNPELWQIMGEKGKKLVEENYNIAELNKKLIKIFQSELKYST